MESNGDILVKVVALEVMYEASSNMDMWAYLTLAASTSSVVGLKIATLLYGVPGYLVDV